MNRDDKSEILDTLVALNRNIEELRKEQKSLEDKVDQLYGDMACFENLILKMTDNLLAQDDTPFMRNKYRQ